MHDLLRKHSQTLQLQCIFAKRLKNNDSLRDSALNSRPISPVPVKDLPRDPFPSPRAQGLTAGRCMWESRRHRTAVKETSRDGEHAPDVMDARYCPRHSPWERRHRLEFTAPRGVEPRYDPHQLGHIHTALMHIRSKRIIMQVMDAKDLVKAGMWCSRLRPIRCLYQAYSRRQPCPRIQDDQRAIN